MKRERKEVAENGQCFSGQAASLPPIRRQFILRWNGIFNQARTIGTIGGIGPDPLIIHYASYAP